MLGRKSCPAQPGNTITTSFMFRVRVWPRAFGGVSDRTNENSILEGAPYYLQAAMTSSKALPSVSIEMQPLYSMTHNSRLAPICPFRMVQMRAARSVASMMTMKTATSAALQPASRALLTAEIAGADLADHPTVAPTKSGRMPPAAVQRTRPRAPSNIL